MYSKLAPGDTLTMVALRVHLHRCHICRAQMVCGVGKTEGIFAQLNYDLIAPTRVKEGRKPEPTGSVLDTQSVKTSTNVPVISQGTDAAKKIVGRKRGILTDTIGLILAVTVIVASLSGNDLGIRLLDQAKKTYPTISKSWVDTQGFGVVA